MKLAYIDTSALVAVAFAEPGHKRLAAKLSRFDRRISSNLLEAEFRATLQRERLEQEQDELLSWISWVFPERSLSAEFQVVLSRGSVRGADLWHLACAVYLRSQLGELTFVTLDQRQGEVAKALELA